MGYLRCWSARNLLDLYVDGRLTAFQSAGVRRHLSACAPCRREAEGLGSAASVLREEPAPAVPEGLAETLLAAYRDGREPAAAPRLRLAPAQALAALYLAALAAGHAAPGLPSQAEPPAPREALR